MIAKRFHWDWKTGRMKDTYSDFQATKDMRLIERSINDACRSYEKQIAKLEKENEQLKIALKDKENLIKICEKKFKELGYLITCDDDGYVIE